MNKASNEKWEQRREGRFIKGPTSSPAPYLYMAKVEGASDFYYAHFESNLFSGPDPAPAQIEFEPSTLLVPKGFQFVRYTIDSATRAITIGPIEREEPTTFTTPVLLNIEVLQSPTQLDPCEKFFVKTQNGCAYPIKYNTDQYYVLFKYKGWITMDDRGVTKQFDHYFMPMLLPNMAICWYAFPVADGEWELGAWHAYAAQFEDAIIGLIVPMYYSDTHMIFITEGARLMK